MKKLIFNTPCFRIILFLLGFVILFSYMTLALIPAFRTDHTNITGLYDLPKNSADVLFIGSSSFYWALSPSILWQEHGIPSYNLSSSAQMTFTAYYRLAEALKYQSPSLVILDASSFMYEADIDSKYYEPFLHNVTDCMRLSDVKLKLAFDVQKKSDDQTATDILFPFFRYHSRLYSGDLSIKNDILLAKYFKSKNITLGCTYTTEHCQIDTDYHDIMSPSDEVATITPFSQEYFQKAIDLCRSKNINVMVFRIPTTKWNYSKYKAVQNFCDTNNIIYFDMNFVDTIDNMGFDYSYDFFDTQHVNIYGAETISKKAGSIIVDTYNLSDKRNYDYSSYFTSMLNQYNNWKSENVSN